MNGETHLFPTYVHPPVEFVRGSGTLLYDVDGVEYLDLTGGIAVNALGHAHPRLVAALTAQAEKLWHTANLFPIRGQREVAAKLCDVTFAERVFFTNSGAEALECSIKAARRFHYNNGQPDRVNILTFEGAFHGRTLATIAAGGQAKYMEGFGPKAPGFISLPFGDHEALRAAVDDETAAILIEPIQGEGGIRSVPPQCLRGLRELCDAHGILLIYDEVQTGVGRTGKFYAHEWAGENGEGAPDILATAKGLGGGFPVGACLATAAVGDALTTGTHGTTFGGNPLAMAVAGEVLDVILEDGFLEQVRQSGILFNQYLAEMVDRFPDLIEDARGHGLLVGLKAKIPNTDIIAAMRAQHLLCVGAGDNVVRFAPPLTINETELRLAREKMMAALETLDAAKTRSA